MLIPSEQPVAKQPVKQFNSKLRTFDTTHNAGMIVFKLKRNSSFRIELHTNKAIECKRSIKVSKTDFILSMWRNHPTTYRRLLNAGWQSTELLNALDLPVGNNRTIVVLAADQEREKSKCGSVENSASLSRHHLWMISSLDLCG